MRTGLQCLLCRVNIQPVVTRKQGKFAPTFLPVPANSVWWVGRVYKVHIDFETRSTAELARQNAVGEHAYADHSTTAPLLLAYKTPEMPTVAVQDLLEDVSLPQRILAANEKGAIFVAHNARFEQAIWYWQMHKRYGWPLIKNWSCTAARARYWGLRASLDGCGSDLEIASPKDPRGAELIKIFCKPRQRKRCKRTGIMTIVKPWGTPESFPLEWEQFKLYCARDVEAEIQVDALLPELPPFEQNIWNLDYSMNWAGLPLDIKMVERAIRFCDYYTQQAFDRFDTLTGGLRPTQRDRVLEYCQAREMDIDNLRSKTLKRLSLVDLEPELRECVAIRLSTAKASVKKLGTMVRCTTADYLARGLILYYGAHTGRDTAKRVQPHNFIRGNRKLQNAFFDFIEDDSIWGDNNEWIETANLAFVKPLDTLSMSMRGFIKAPEGERFIIADYAQIEARVLAWLARADRKLKAFRNGSDLYCLFASVLYNHDYRTFFDSAGKVKEEFAKERQIAKSAELGCGFGLGGDAFVEYCDNMDIIIEREKAIQVVKAWRGDNPEIVDYWSKIERAAKLAALYEGRTTRVGPITFHIHRVDEIRWWLVCTLPSGRHIAYFRPRLREGYKWGNTPVTILSFRTEWNGKSFREDTYGGKLVENIVQGCARDIMKVGIQNAVNAGYVYRLAVHDEGIFTRPKGEGSFKELEILMCDLPYWIGDCPVTAEGKECIRYSK